MSAIVSTLHSSDYVDSVTLQRERHAIFLRSWLFAGHVCEFSIPGDFVTVPILDQSVIVTKIQSGEIRAYHNVCSHRAHQLLTGKGNCKAIVCPYHSWSYRLDGTLQHAPNARNVPGFSKENYDLKTVRVEILAGFVFINLDSAAPSLASQAPTLAADIASEFPSFGKLNLINQDSAACRSNWKIAVENFLECYHCRRVHESFCSIFELSTYHYKLERLYSTQKAAARIAADSWYSISPDDDPRHLVFWGLFPNTMFSLFPGTSSVGVMTADPDPTDPNRCTLRFNTYGTKPAGQVFSEGFVELLANTLREDIACCESVQRGLQSVAYQRGPLLIDEQLSGISEHAVHHFQNLIRHALSL